MRRKGLAKKLFAGTMALCMGFSLAACGGNSQEGSTSAEASKDSYKIAVVKQMDHASLDQIADAVTAQLDVIAKEKGVNIEYEVYSGQGEQSTLTQIGEEVVGGGADAIIPIATLAAQVMTTCAEDTKTPVVYAAISDPEAAELTGIDYVTGTSDALDTSFIMDMIFEQNPDAKNIGLLYSLSEANSKKPIEEAKEYLDEKNVKYTEATGNTNDEVISAASVLVSEKVDAIFTPTDNIVMAAELSNADTFIEAGIPHYTGADSFVRNGAYATCGVNYTDLGTKTADLAYQAITEGMDNMEDYYTMNGGIITVNTETAAALKLDYSVFKNMAEVVEVTTSED